MPAAHPPQGVRSTVVLVGELYDVDDLVGAGEIADLLGVNPGVVRDWRTRDLGFPEPIKRLTMGSLWSWPEVERWAKATGRLE